MQQTSPIRNRNEEGFLLVAMVVAAVIILIFLAAAAPSVAKDLQREREIETVHRGNQYVRAIRLYYRKFGHYPSSVDQLVKSNNIRFLREKYIDPMTGKDDWRIIHVGENKTTVTGFFGQPLAGLATSGLGSASGMVSTTGNTSGGAGNIGSATGTSGAAFGNTTFGGASTGSTPTPGGANSNNASGPGGTGTGGGASGSGSSGSGNGSGPASTDATTFSGGGGSPIMGVSSLSPKESIISIRKQTTYDTWEFLYDPRIETLYAKANIFGGGVSSASATGLNAGSLSSPGSSTTSTSPQSGANSGNNVGAGGTGSSTTGP